MAEGQEERRKRLKAVTEAAAQSQPDSSFDAPPPSNLPNPLLADVPTGVPRFFACGPPGRPRPPPPPPPGLTHQPPPPPYPPGLPHPHAWPQPPPLPYPPYGRGGGGRRGGGRGPRGGGRNQGGRGRGGARGNIGGHNNNNNNVGIEAYFSPQMLSNPWEQLERQFGRGTAGNKAVGSQNGDGRMDEEGLLDRPWH